MLCPLRVLAHEADFENEENKGTIKYDNIDAHCLEKRCAWWNRDFEMCSIAALATVGTPINANDIIGRVYFIEGSSYEGFAEILGVNNDDTVNVRSEYTGKIYIVEKDDLVSEQEAELPAAY